MTRLLPSCEHWSAAPDCAAAAADSSTEKEVILHRPPPSEFLRARCFGRRGAGTGASPTSARGPPLLVAVTFLREVFLSSSARLWIWFCLSSSYCCTLCSLCCSCCCWWWW